MQYISTRNTKQTFTFRDVFLKGLASDGGLYIPKKIPSYSVVVPGSLPSKNNPDGPALYCVVIIKQVDEKTRSKTSINDLLRE